MGGYRRDGSYLIKQPKRVLSCRERLLHLGERTLIMGILNATPDSFSDGGRFNRVDLAVQHAIEMVEQGADLIDIGGESTRPGAEFVSLEQELERVIPVIEALQDVITVPISIDTYKSKVARQALAAGAHLINDVWGCKRDPAIADVAVQYGCPIIMTHNRETLPYRSLITDVLSDLQESIHIASQAGVHSDFILVDPGIGFAKNYEENLTLMGNLHQLTRMGYPVVLGTSRKRMIQHTLGLPANQVLEGTAATVALGIAQGCSIIRVHDVQHMSKVAAMTDAIVYAQKD